MARKTLTAPLKVVGTAATDAILEVSSTEGSDSQTNATTLIYAGGDLNPTSVGGMRVLLGSWCETNIATSLTTATAQTLGEVAGMTEICMPRAGSIIGISACLSANLTAGTLRVCASKNGTTVFSAVNSATGVRVIHGTQAKDTDTFAAGDRIGCKIVTTATFAPTTLEGVFAIEVEM